jgi:hypothetical protein
MQRVWHKYNSRQDHKPTTVRQAAEWAVAEGLLELPEVDALDVLAEKIVNAIRTETRTDSQGRRYRVNHAVRAAKSGIQYTFWGVMGFASHTHMAKSFSQRRRQIVDDNFHLKTDVDVYNESILGEHPQIPLVLDYTDDVAEREEMEKMKNRRNAA